MPPTDPLQICRRVLELRESFSEPEAFSRELVSRLSFSPAEAQALARVLEDRFLSGEEQLDLLGTLEMDGLLSSGAQPSHFIQLLSGLDGREALRHHARHLVDELSQRTLPRESGESAADPVQELIELFPRGLRTFGAEAMTWNPLRFGLSCYGHAEDSFFRNLVEELRENLSPASDPVLRMRSIRILANWEEPRAGALLRESEAALRPAYSGPISVEERIARAGGLAADSHSAGIRFLQNAAMDPELPTYLRYRALTFLHPEDLNNPNVREVFRSLVEDPEEPVPTRYLMLSLLARSPNPPESEWWEGLMGDPSMNLTLGAPDPERSEAEYSSVFQWHLVLEALSEAAASWAEQILLEVAQNDVNSTTLRRAALMSYFRSVGRGEVSWETFLEVFGSFPGPWRSTLERVGGDQGELRIRFPSSEESEDCSLADGVRDFEICEMGFFEKELVGSVRERGGTLRLEFRPFDPDRDAPSAVADFPISENAFPRNRRVSLGSFEPETSEEVIPSAAETGEAAHGQQSARTETPSGRAQGHRNDVEQSETLGI